MKTETALFLFCLTLPFCGFTQIVKNTQSFGGYGQLGYQSQLVDYAVSSSTETTQTNFELLPRYARFLTDKFMVEARPIIGYNSEQINSYVDTTIVLAPNRASPFLTSKTQITDLGLNLGTRYYLLHDTKVKLFAEGRAGLLHRIAKLSFSDRGSLSGNVNVYNLGASVGANYFISKNIAIEATANFDRVVYSKNGPKENVLSFDLGLRNFIVDFRPDETDAQKSAVEQNRFSIDSRISYQKNSSSMSTQRGEIFRAKISYAHFILRGWLLGGTYNHQSRFSNVRNSPGDIYLENRVNAFDVLASDYSATIFTRYYIPLGKKLFIHPHAQFSFGESPFIFHTNATIALGGSYFLTRNVAIEAIVVEKTFNSRLGDPIFGGANIGIRYFLGK